MQQPKDPELSRLWQHSNGDHGLRRVNAMDFVAIHNVAIAVSFFFSFFFFFLLRLRWMVWQVVVAPTLLRCRCTMRPLECLGSRQLASCIQCTYVVPWCLCHNLSFASMLVCTMWHTFLSFFPFLFFFFHFPYSVGWSGYASFFLMMRDVWKSTVRSFISEHVFVLLAIISVYLFIQIVSERV